MAGRSGSEGTRLYGSGSMAAQVELLKLHLMTGLSVGLVPVAEFLHKRGFVRRRRVQIVPPKLDVTTKFRKIPSSNETRPTESVIASGVVPRFVQFLKKKNSPKLQHEAAWVITNIAFDKPEVVIDNGAVQILVERLDSPNDDVPDKPLFVYIRRKNTRAEGKEACESEVEAEARDYT